ncbi:S-adenosyl-L-methionine-dependent methyltransferase [Hypoxylon fragiforme]|uniref:S-adenosyl-L-methionine-dependent methyltransferase n=1 Tax=Hypoxylon fragiforme TaxID=63214 RepID=UPI0020C63064|nr:S-adenosyl-L-methionine-dependent methyltransferase [Hypoxylon fragiforme]KAI2610705.1 S-adenosyl-L-methionine-dependent methyltransferase [Hypoxylon fragiforme]
MSFHQGEDISDDIDSILSASVADDDEEEDGYDGYSSRFSLDSVSVSDDVRDYIFENSRRYHKYYDGLYHFPNDDAEQEREDLQHAMVILLCEGKLHFAPLDNPQSVLDIGTGTGIWAIEMGDEYPQADILGIDLSPIQPLWVPRNVQFLVDNVEEEWVQPANSLDYIHSRQMAPSIRDWPTIFSEAYNHFLATSKHGLPVVSPKRALKPGGWIEIQDLKCITRCEDALPADEPCHRFTSTLVQALRGLGIDCIHSIDHYEPWLRAAGFANVQTATLKAPLGTWPDNAHDAKIGLFNRNMIYSGLHAFSIRPFTHGLGWTPEEVEVYLVDVRKSLLTSQARLYFPWVAVWAQKPLEPVVGGEPNAAGPIGVPST